MKYKVNDIVHGTVPVSMADILSDKNIKMKFVGKIVEVNKEAQAFKMKPYICSDLYGKWHSIIEDVHEHPDFVQGLCNAEQFDLFHDVSNDKSRQIPEEKYFDEVAMSIILHMHNDML